MVASRCCSAELVLFLMQKKGDISLMVCQCWLFYRFPIRQNLENAGDPNLMLEIPFVFSLPIFSFR